jgi:DedD protein
MANTAEPDPTEVRRRGRQRLIGAIAIVLLAVVFVPMVLDSEPRPERKEPTLAIPPKEGAPQLPAPAPATEPAKVAEAPNASEPPKTSEPPKSSEPPKAATVAAPKPAAAPAKPAAAPPKPAAEAPRLEGFAVQVGAFRDEDKLREAREKLAAAKLKHFTERLPDGITRLRAGPYPTREAAEKAQGALAAAGFKDGKIVTLP